MLHVGLLMALRNDTQEHEGIGKPTKATDPGPCKTAMLHIAVDPEVKEQPEILVLEKKKKNPNLSNWNTYLLQFR